MILLEIKLSIIFSTGPIRCDMTSEGKVQPWKHGATIARALKNVKMDGLTGSIRYISNIQLPNCNKFYTTK